MRKVLRLDKITEPDSLRAVQCREDDVFVFPENAPCAWQTVALRFNSCTIKSQIGFGLSHTTLKYLERLKLSIKVSIINERIASPRNEYSPVCNVEHETTSNGDQHICDQKSMSDIYAGIFFSGSLR